MSNTSYVNFAFGFVADGSSSGIVVDFSEGPVSYTMPGGTPFIVSPKAATSAANVLLDDTVAVASAVISRGVLTVGFATPPTSGDHIVSGRLLF